MRMDIWTLAIQLLSVLALIYWYLKRKHNYWAQRNLIGPKPTFLLGELWIKSQSTVELENEWRNKYGKLYGTYQGLKPVLTISDAELIKQIMVKDFAHFVNRREQNVYHEVMNENLFALEDEKWKVVRTITSPTFTSGKLKGMQVLMNRCVDKLIDYFNNLTIKPGAKLFKTKEVVTGFTIDVIATTTFATETNANDDRKEMSPLVKAAQNIFNFNLAKVSAMFLFPLWLNNLLGFRFVNDYESAMFFVNLCKQIVKQRKSNPAYRRNDLVQLLLDAKVDVKEIKETGYDKLAASMDEEKPDTKSTLDDKNSVKQGLTDNEIVAQCLLFFIAGFETTATTISFALHELAINQDCQERLVEEIQEATADIEDPNSDEYFDTVTNRIPYLEGVMKETLRKYPPVIRLERRAGIDGYEIGNVKLYKNQLIEVSAYAVHHNPEYYPEPERWDPERFLPENKSKLVPYTYIPFGVGPRNCVGMRFAYQEIKLCLARLVTKFRFQRAPTTKHPVELKKGAFLVSPVSLDLYVERR